MFQYGKLVTCDRCGAEVFLKSIGLTYKGGTEMREYQELPEDWDGYSDSPGGRHLCPSCKFKYDVMMDRFNNDLDWDCGVVLETCVKNSISDICISPEELAEASARAAEAMKRMVGG